MRFAEADIEKLLDAYPHLRRAPARDPGISIVVGKLGFSLEPHGKLRIDDAYAVHIEVRVDGVDDVPVVIETGGRIKHDVDAHNPGGKCCLGSPLAIRLQLGRHPTLVHFVDQCVVPFLYAASWRSLGYAGWPFGELPHYTEGVQDDYLRLLRLARSSLIGRALDLLGERRRIANKRICPCGCEKRLGRCAYRLTIERLRAAGTRRSYRRLAADYRSRIK